MRCALTSVVIRSGWNAPTVAYALRSLERSVVVANRPVGSTLHRGVADAAVGAIRQPALPIAEVVVEDPLDLVERVHLMQAFP